MLASYVHRVTARAAAFRLRWRDHVADVVVIGGGIAGLAAAYDLTAAGRRVRVLDAGPRPRRRDADRACGRLGRGSRARLRSWCRSRRRSRSAPSSASRASWSRRSSRARRTCCATAASTRCRRARSSASPCRYAAWRLSSLFTPLGKTRMAAEALMPARDWDDGDDESIAAFVGRRFGREAVDYLAEPLLAGIHAGDVDTLSVRLLFPRLVDTERQHGSLLRAFRAHEADAVAARRVRLADRRRRRRSWRRSCLACRRTPLVRGCRALASSATRRRTATSWTRRRGRGRARAVVLAVPSYEAATLRARASTTRWPRCATPSATRPPPRWRSAIARIRWPIRCAAPASWCRAPRGGHCWRPRGSRRSGQDARRPATCCSARFFGGGRDPHRLDQHDDAGLIAAGDARSWAAVLGITGDPVRRA